MIENTSWTWAIAGLLLCVVELVVPGVFLIFFGLAALGVALILAFYPLSLAGALVVFAVLALISVLLGRILYGRAQISNERGLNDNPARALAGRRLVLSDPIVNGLGQARVQDGVWRVRGPDAPAGALVRVTGLEAGGAVLLVEIVSKEQAPDQAAPH